MNERIARILEAILSDRYNSNLTITITEETDDKTLEIRQDYPLSG